MKQIWLEKDGTLQVLTDESLDDVKRVLVTTKGSLYGSLFYPDELRPKGEWLEKEVHEKGVCEDIEEWQSAKCSVCGRYHTTPYMYYFSDYNFCPNCGADMRE